MGGGQGKRGGGVRARPPLHELLGWLENRYKTLNLLYHKSCTLQKECELLSIILRTNKWCSKSNTRWMLLVIAFCAGH